MMLRIAIAAELVRDNGSVESTISTMPLSSTVRLAVCTGDGAGSRDVVGHGLERHSAGQIAPDGGGEGVGRFSDDVRAALC